MPSGLVIFDCDGVLVDTEPIAIDIRVDVLARAGWPLSADEIVERFLGRSHAYVVSEVERRVGTTAAQEAEEEFRVECERAFRERLQPIAGIVDVLADLAGERGIRTCVASSGGHDKIRLTLGLTGLLPQFEGRIFSAEDVTRGKPAPDLFELAAATMGVPVGHCVVVEDSPAGVVAGRAAGMSVIGYAGGVTAPGALALDDVVVIEDMAELPAQVRFALST